MLPDRPIYLDHHSTTPVDPRVVDAMLPYWTEKFGNAASHHHRYGWEAEEAVRIARERVAKLIGADSREIVFTSGATESNNLALKGVAEAYFSKGNHLVISSIEHKCVLDVAKRLESVGFSITRLPVDGEGFVDPDAVRSAIHEKTILISIMMGNNEIGTVQPVAEIGRMAKERGVLFHTDLAQVCGKLPVRVEELNVDLASLSAHKMYGPKGVGALYVRRRHPHVRLTAQMDGGGHEGQMRSGTLNVPGIVGFGKAAELALDEMDSHRSHVRSLRDLLYEEIADQIPVRLNGPAFSDKRLPNNLNVSFEGVDAEGLITGLKTIAVSTGSACMSAVKEPSYVLRAIGLSDELAHASIRIGVGRTNTVDEMHVASARLIDVVRLLRG